MPAAWGFFQVKKNIFVPMCTCVSVCRRPWRDALLALLCFDARGATCGSALSVFGKQEDH